MRPTSPASYQQEAQPGQHGVVEDHAREHDEGEERAHPPLLRHSRTSLADGDDTTGGVAMEPPRADMARALDPTVLAGGVGMDPDPWQAEVLR